MLFSRDLEIAFGDCDPAGIVFYPNYFRFFDTSTAMLFAEALGMKQAEWAVRYDVVGIPMVDTGSSFKCPSRFGDVVVIKTEVIACRRSSFDVRHQLFNEGQLAVEGRETRVWVGRDPQNPGGIRAKALPAEVVRALGHEPAER
ncbi:4-hydroxybenzoyl-CoA thioesterase [Devosia sp. Root685]|uniref:acyl-CoA thioesterase n=1 Tax=Devosia sp. Root685 TaxID=1736587 RepID=UPI00070227E5|nr:thioesterase family protein [Devosia sp. Root685]KRA95184.1 4-hydroxybenzoyl-CoA thioesterase [Devosia sp. Root685]